MIPRALVFAFVFVSEAIFILPNVQSSAVATTKKAKTGNSHLECEKTSMNSGIVGFDIFI